MSNNYYLCDDDAKELFMLGKGSHVWENLFPFELDTSFKLNKVLNKLQARIVQEVDWDSDPDYYNWLFWRLVDWIDNRTVCLISELSPHGDEIFYNNWVYENYPEDSGKFDEELGFYEIVSSRYEENDEDDPDEG
jgi:hypothetical protein